MPELSLSYEKLPKELLITLAEQGDSEALRALFERYGADVVPELSLSYEKLPEKLLITLAEQGDSEALRALFERYEGPIHRHIRRSGIRDDEVVSELTHETFIKV